MSGLIASFHHPFSFSAAPATWPMPSAHAAGPFLAPSPNHPFARWKAALLNLDRQWSEPDPGAKDSSDDIGSEGDVGCTTAVLKVAYDGTHFRGSSDSSAPKGKGRSITVKCNESNGRGEDPPSGKPPNQRRQSRRSRALQLKGNGGVNDGAARTVEGAIRSSLAKLYGNVDPGRVVIESCSRTDAGVHAASLVAQFYCPKGPRDDAGGIPTGPATTRPTSRGDANFLPLPFDPDLSKLVFVLNRMLPPDVRVVAASRLPRLSASTVARVGAINGRKAAFHPTLHATSKTYAYKFAIGPTSDPLRARFVWHLDGSSARAVGMNGKRFRLERALLAADLFVDPDDEGMSVDGAEPRDYSAFRSAFRGSDRGRTQNTTCKLWRCEILQEREEILPSWENDAPGGGDVMAVGTQGRGGRLGKAATDSGEESPGLNESPRTFTVVITGDRFLYKMVRNIVGMIVASGCGHVKLEDISLALHTGKWGGNESSTEDVSIDTGEHLREDASSSCETISKTRSIRRICAPARGLTLVDVRYHEDIQFDWRTG